MAAPSGGRTWRVLIAVVLLLPLQAEAQHDHIPIYASEPGGGRLVLDYDFDKRVNVFEIFCAAGLCLYSTINPAFMAPAQDPPGEALFPLVDGTRVLVEIVAADAKVTLNVDGARLKKAGDAAVLGTMPTLHNHPSWQLIVPEGEEGEYSITYKVRDEAGTYAESAAHTSRLSNVPQALPTPCPAYPCPGDCNGDGEPTEAEIAAAVEDAVAGSGVGDCVGIDATADGVLTVNEIVAAVEVRVAGCPEPLPATLADIQDTIFSPTCALPACHDSITATSQLTLDPVSAFDDLVGVPPFVAAARDAGLLRVTAGNPEQSFLYRKLVGPRPEWGSRMPLSGPCLPPEQIDQVRRWIESGAMP